MDYLIDLDNINKEDALSLATSLLYSLKGFPQYATTSELAYILDYKNFLNLIRYYGGMTIRIPTVEELNSTLKVIVLYQSYEVEKLSWEEALKKAGIKQSESISAKMKLNNFKKILRSQEVGGVKYD